MYQTNKYSTKHSILKIHWQCGKNQNKMYTDISVLHTQRNGFLKSQQQNNFSLIKLISSAQRVNGMAQKLNAF